MKKFGNSVRGGSNPAAEKIKGAAIRVANQLKKELKKPLPINPLVKTAVFGGVGVAALVAPVKAVAEVKEGMVVKKESIMNNTMDIYRVALDGERFPRFAIYASKKFGVFSVLGDFIDVGTRIKFEDALAKADGGIKTVDASQSVIAIDGENIVAMFPDARADYKFAADELDKQKRGGR